MSKRNRFKQFMLALCAVLAGAGFIEQLAKIKQIKRDARKPKKLDKMMTEQQEKKMHEYAKLLVTPGWSEVDIYPFSDKAYERFWQELKEDHEQGKHKVHHYIDCIDCRKEFNNETENS